MIETFIKTRSATEVYSVCVYDWGCYDYEIVVGQKVQIKFQVNEQIQTLKIDGAEVLTRSDTHNELFNASIFAGKTRRTEYSWVGNVIIENLHVKADSNCKGKENWLSKKYLYQFSFLVETLIDFWYGGIITDNKIYSSSSGYELLNHESSIGEIKQNPSIDFTSLPKNPCIKMTKIDDPASGAKVDYKVIDCDSVTSTFICIKKPQDCSGISKSGGGISMIKIS